MKTKKKDGKRKVVRKARRKPVDKPLSNLQRAIKRVIGPISGIELPKEDRVTRVTGMAAELAPYAPTSHEQLKDIMTGLARAGSPIARGWSVNVDAGDERDAHAYSPEPAASARGAYTRPARW
jgi:hypothetical protein